MKTPTEFTLIEPVPKIVIFGIIIPLFCAYYFWKYTNSIVIGMSQGTGINPEDALFLLISTFFLCYAFIVLRWKVSVKNGNLELRRIGTKRIKFSSISGFRLFGYRKGRIFLKVVENESFWRRKVITIRRVYYWDSEYERFCRFMTENYRNLDFETGTGQMTPSGDYTYRFRLYQYFIVLIRNFVDYRVFLILPVIILGLLSRSEIFFQFALFLFILILVFPLYHLFQMAFLRIRIGEDKIAVWKFLQKREIRSREISSFTFDHIRNSLEVDIEGSEDFSFPLGFFGTDHFLKTFQKFVSK